MNLLRFIFLVFCLTIIACKESADEVGEIEIYEPKVEFTIDDNPFRYEGTFDPIFGVFSIPVYQDSESKIVNDILLNSFDFISSDIESIKIKLHYIHDIIDGRPNLESLMLKGLKGETINYILDQSTHKGFGVTIEMSDNNNESWYSFDRENVTQAASIFEVIDIIESDTATYFEADFSCVLFNDSGASLEIKSGKGVFKLKD